MLICNVNPQTNPHGSVCKTSDTLYGTAVDVSVVLRLCDGFNSSLDQA